MPYSFPLSLTIPANTPIGAPVGIDANSGLPVASGGLVRFPPGPAGLAFVRLLTRYTPIWPTVGGWANGDDIQYTFDGYWRMDGPPWRLRLEGYNLDDTYPHTITAVVFCGGLQ